ncbi:hypothetical protein BOVMAS37_09550 [Streptococcus uberis]
MSNVLYVTDIFLDDYKTNFALKYLPFYVKNDRKSILNIFQNEENVIDSKIKFEYKELFLESQDPDANKKNLKIIWESLNHLTPIEAANEKIWVALENTYYLDYHLDQLSLITGKNRETSIISRTIFTQGNKRSLLINNLSSLWWIAYYTVDYNNSNIYYYSDRFMNGSYRGNAIAYFSSNLVSNKEIVLGTLDAIYELIDNGKMIENRYSYTASNKILNLAGGVIILDLLSRQEIKELVLENLLKMENVKVGKTTQK